MKPSALLVPIKPHKASYVPIQKHWRRLKSIFESPAVQAIWRANFEEFGQQRIEERAALLKRPAEPFKWLDRHKLPRDFDSCDWRCVTGRRGPDPKFWDYACHSACHWIVDTCLYVAQKAFPNESWTIITSHKHSTCWNGKPNKPLLFDINFLALDVAPNEAVELAMDKGRILKTGRYLRSSTRYVLARISRQ